MSRPKASVRSAGSSSFTRGGRFGRIDDRENDFALGEWDAEALEHSIDERILLWGQILIRDHDARYQPADFASNALVHVPFLFSRTP